MPTLSSVAGLVVGGVATLSCDLVAQNSGMKCLMMLVLPDDKDT